MQVREVTAEDGEVVREIGRRSMEASYSLSPETIESAVSRWYDSENLAEKIDDEAVLLLLVESDGEPVAFSESAIVDHTGDIYWLHVDPDYRTEGFGARLYEATTEALEATVDTVRGHVLADNAAGNAFYEDRGLTKVGEDAVEIAGTSYVENVYVRDPSSELTPITGPDGTQLFVDRTDADRGSKGGFYTAYVDSGRERVYGSFCANCESVVASMDSMGRMECEVCGNRSKPTRWDAAYL